MPQCGSAGSNSWNKARHTSHKMALNRRPSCDVAPRIVPCACPSSHATLSALVLDGSALSATHNRISTKSVPAALAVLCGRVPVVRPVNPAGRTEATWRCSSKIPQAAPNNSFKPTPCRGVGRVLYATLAHGRRPATGRLNSGVSHHNHNQGEINDHQRQLSASCSYHQTRA